MCCYTLRALKNRLKQVILIIILAFKTRLQRYSITCELRALAVQKHRKGYESTERATEVPEEIRKHQNKKSLYYYTSVYIYSRFASYRTASLSFSAMADNT
jgi:hypothetical protein